MSDIHFNITQTSCQVKIQKTSDLFDGPRLQVELEGLEPYTPNMPISDSWL